MNRLLAALLTVAVLGLVLFSMLGSGPTIAPLQAASSEPMYDAPRGFIATELLPMKVPGVHERQVDKVHRPYHLLVRVVRFKDLTPIDIEADRLVVPGARETRKVDTGTFLFKGLSLGLLSVSLLAEDQESARTPHRSGPVYTTVRNPVCLARNAVTTCDLIVLDEQDARTRVEPRGLVVDRFTGEALAGVHVVRLNDEYVITDEDGHFQFDESLPVAGLFGLRFLLDGYVPIGVSALSLSRTWVEHFHDTGEAIFTLRPEILDR